MTLTIHTEQDDQRQLKLTIEVPEDRIEQQMQVTARKLAKDVNIPGFRRGKAPYSVILKRIGRDALRGEAVEDLIQPIFEEAMKELDPDIYAPAQFNDLEMEPLVIKFTIPLTPEVTLGDYRSLRKEIEPVNITDEAVEEAIERLRGRHQVLEDVERPAAEGDMVTISGRGELIIEVTDDEESPADDEAETLEDAAEDEADSEDEEDDEDQDDVLFDTERMNLVMDSKTLFPGTPFVENIVGMAVGDNKEFSFVFPEDFEDEDLAGKEAMFNISVLQVQNRELPAIDDELAQKEGQETVDELREVTRKNLLAAAEQEFRNELIEGMIKDMAESATLVYPPAAVESEIDGRVESFKQQVTRSGWEWADYLKLQVTTEEALREDFREAAEVVVRQQLILREFVLSEKLSIKEEDVDAKIAARIAAFSDNEMLANSMRDYYRKGAGFNSISGDILMDKVAERMQAILTGTAPSLEEIEAAEAAASEAEAEIEADIVDEETETAVEIESGVEAETAVETEPEPTTETSTPETDAVE